MTLLLTFALLSGSVLVVWQMGLVLVLFTAFHPGRWKWTLTTLLATALITAPVTLPVLLHSPYTHQGRQIFCGWGCPSGDITSRGFWHLWDGLTRRYTIEQDASWEQSLYVGPFLLVFLGCVRRTFNRFDLAMAAVGLLSLGPVLGWLYNGTGLPVIDRLPTRLSIYPFTWFLYRSLSPGGRSNPAPLDG